MAPRGSPREPKGELNGAKIGVKIQSRIGIDFQAIFDAKIMRESVQIEQESRTNQWEIKPETTVDEKEATSNPIEKTYMFFNISLGCSIEFLRIFKTNRIPKCNEMEHDIFLDFYPKEVRKIIKNWTKKDPKSEEDR